MAQAPPGPQVEATVAWGATQGVQLAPLHPVVGLGLMQWIQRRRNPVENSHWPRQDLNPAEQTAQDSGDISPGASSAAASPAELSEASAAVSGMSAERSVGGRSPVGASIAGPPSSEPESTDASPAAEAAAVWTVPSEEHADTTRNRAPRIGSEERRAAMTRGYHGASWCRRSRRMRSRAREAAT